ncbi:MAG: TIGR02186 family protein [Pseudomonadota bacterium]
MADIAVYTSQRLLFGLSLLAFAVSLAAGRAIADPKPGIASPPVQTESATLDPAVAAANAEEIEADVSTRSVAITSSFTGIEIIVFGAIANAQPEIADAGDYDIVVILEGASERHITRKKNRIAGIWVNTQAITFDDVPSYYAIYSTKPLDEIADPFTLRQNDIGFERIRMRPVKGWETGITAGGLADFREALVRLKRDERRYIQDEYGVNFVGRSLFRATVDLPANVPVGPLKARVHLFRQGVLLDTFNTVVKLERQGLERVLYVFAFDYPLLYGLFAVLMAVCAGLLASAIVARVRR